MALDDYLTKVKWGTNDRFAIEANMVRRGGYLEGNGQKLGNGYKYHFIQAQKALMPWIDRQRWFTLMTESFCDYEEVGVMGSASSGKTFAAAAWAYTQFQIFPKQSSIIFSTTTKDGLQLRVFGQIKEIHKRAKELRPYLSGRVIDSRSMITGNEEEDEAQDFRNGLIGVAAKIGGEFVGISNYVGIKNDYLILIADEASLMARGFLDAVSNLRKGGKKQFRLFAMGNPKDRNDPLGSICEPHPDDGGWEGHEFVEKTRTWRTRTGGLAIQLCGTDSPNYDHPRGLNPHIGIITPEHIEKDAKSYGVESLQYSMMNLGMMPKDGEKRRIITVSLCETKQAFEDAIWGHEKRKRVVSLDAAYSGAGGDRTVLSDLEFGGDPSGSQILSFAEPQQIIQTSIRTNEPVEEQIAVQVMRYCQQRGIPPEDVGFDSTGRGTLMSAFARLWSPNVVPIEFGGKAPERPVRAGSKELESEVYYNMVTALWYASRLVIEGRQMRQLARDVALEGSYREWKIVGRNLIQVEPKEDTKKRMGRSPDLWDSLVVGVEMARRRGFQIAAGAAVSFKKQPIPSWMLDRQKVLRNKQYEKELTYA